MQHNNARVVSRNLWLLFARYNSYTLLLVLVTSPHLMKLTTPTKEDDYARCKSLFCSPHSNFHDDKKVECISGRLFKSKMSVPRFHSATYSYKKCRRSVNLA